MAYTWEHFTAYLDGTRPITTAERDELWDALADLLTRCGGRWQLVEEDMAAIKASSLATDKTVVEDPEDAGDFREGDLAVVLIDIEDTFTGTTGLDAFKAVAGDEGLSEAQLAELVTESGRATPVDTFHLWNLYKRVLDYLSCCPTALPAFEYDSVGKSLSKCGYQSTLTGPESNKRWLKKTFCYSPISTQAGVLTVLTMDPETCVETSDGGTCEGNCIDTFGWPFSPTGYVNLSDGKRYRKVTRTWTAHCDQVCPGFTSSRDYDYGEIQDFVSTDVAGGCFTPRTTYWGTSSSSWAVDGETVYSCTATRDPVTGEWSGTATTPEGSSAISSMCPQAPNGSVPPCVLDCWTDYDEVWEDEIIKPDPVYEDEYLTPALITNVQAAIAAEGFDGDFNDTAGSYRNLSADELSYSERQSKARLPIAGLGLADGRTYNAIYVVRFTPNVGVPVDGGEQTLAITFATGMTHSTPVDLPLPTENGVNTAVLLRWECPEGGEGP